MLFECSMPAMCIYIGLLVGASLLTSKQSLAANASPASGPSAPAAPAAVAPLHAHPLLSICGYRALCGAVLRRQGALQASGPPDSHKSWAHSVPSCAHLRCACLECLARVLDAGKWAPVNAGGTAPASG